LIEQLLANLLTWFARSKLGLPIIFAALVFLGIFIEKNLRQWSEPPMTRSGLFLGRFS
jgi:hypothetical protein